MHGYLVAYLNIQPFIVTLAGMFLARGLTAVVSTEMIAIKNEVFLSWANNKIYLPFGTVNKKDVYLPAYIYPTVIIAILVVVLIFLVLVIQVSGVSFMRLVVTHRAPS